MTRGLNPSSPLKGRGPRDGMYRPKSTRSSTTMQAKGKNETGPLLRR